MSETTTTTRTAADFGPVSVAFDLLRSLAPDLPMGFVTVHWNEPQGRPAVDWYTDSPDAVRAWGKFLGDYEARHSKATGKVHHNATGTVGGCEVVVAHLEDVAA